MLTIFSQKAASASTGLLRFWFQQTSIFFAAKSSLNIKNVPSGSWWGNLYLQLPIKMIFHVQIITILNNIWVAFFQDSDAKRKDDFFQFCQTSSKYSFETLMQKIKPPIKEKWTLVSCDKVFPWALSGILENRDLEKKFYSFTNRKFHFK